MERPTWEYRKDKAPLAGMHHPLAGVNLKDGGDVTHARRHEPQPVQPSALSTGCPASSMISAAAPCGHASAQALHVTFWKVMQRSGMNSSTPMR